MRSFKGNSYDKIKKRGELPPCTLADTPTLYTREALAASDQVKTNQMPNLIGAQYNVRPSDQVILNTCEPYFVTSPNKPLIYNIYIYIYMFIITWSLGRLCYW